MSCKFPILFILTLISCGRTLARAEENPAGNAAPPYVLSVSELEAALGIDSETQAPTDFLRVVYFHRTPGCPTCQKMARMVFETLKADFATEVQSRPVVLRYVDFEDTRYSALVRALRVQGPSLFLIEVRNGKENQAWNLNRVWPLAGNEPEFRSYVREQIRSRLR